MNIETKDDCQEEDFDHNCFFKTLRLLYRR